MEIGGRKTVRQFKSSRNPSVVYSVMTDQEGILYCDCPAWKFQPKASQFRDCKHVKLYVADRAKEVQQEELNVDHRQETKEL